MRAGFSLIQLSILLAVLAVLFASAIPGQSKNSDDSKYAQTLKKITRLENALIGWRAANNKYPCPADLGLADTNANFGVAAANAGSCTGGMPAANYTPANVAIGMVPVKTLGLSPEDAIDAWGRRITYFVDKRATTNTNQTLLSIGQTFQVVCNTATNPAGVWIVLPTSPNLVNGDKYTISNWNSVGSTVPSCTGTDFNGEQEQQFGAFGPIGDRLAMYGGGGYGSTNSRNQLSITRLIKGCATAKANDGGAISVAKNNVVVSKAIMALISHGPNGHGGYVKNGTAFNAQSANAAEQDNASVNSSFASAADPRISNDARSNDFDDIVRATNSCP